MKSLKIRLFGAIVVLGMMLLASGINAGEDAPESEEIEKAEPSQSFMQRGWQYAKNNPKKAAVGLAVVTGAGLSTRRYMQNRQKESSATEQALRKKLNQTFNRMKSLAILVLYVYYDEKFKLNEKLKKADQDHEDYYRTKEFYQALTYLGKNWTHQGFYADKGTQDAIKIIDEIFNAHGHTSSRLNLVTIEAINILSLISQ